MFRSRATLFASRMGLPALELKNILNSKPVTWLKTDNAYFPYKTEVKGEEVKLRVGDFPDEPLYTATNHKGEDILEVNGFLDNWDRPSSYTTKP